MPFVDAIALATRAETPKVLSWCRFDYRLDRAGGRLTLPINKLAGSECPRVLVRERRCRPREHDHGECIAPDGRVFNPSEHCCRMSRRTSDQTLSSLGLEATTALLIASPRRLARNGAKTSTRQYQRSRQCRRAHTTFATSHCCRDELRRTLS